MPRSIGQLKDGKFGEIMPKLDKDLGVKAFYSKTAREKDRELKNIEQQPGTDKDMLGSAPQTSDKKGGNTKHDKGPAGSESTTRDECDDNGNEQ